MQLIRVIFDNTDKFLVLCSKESGTKAGMIAMKYGIVILGTACVLLAGMWACEPLDDDRETHVISQDNSFITLEEVARLLSSVPLGTAQMEEVLDAASSSANNGYDEEYRMQDLFSAPGTGVGSEADTKAGDRYGTPLRDLLSRAIQERFATKVEGADALAWLDSLASSDVQIYWPYSEGWNGASLPVITFDPGDNALQNEGYAFQADGSVKRVLVDEQMAREQPVWVVNRNADAQHKTLEMMRREDPSWGQGGGGLVVKSGEDTQTLILRSFKAKRQLDSWFCGGAEFFVKIGSVEDFHAATEAELRLYEPSITDFMVVVRRKDVGEELSLNTVLVSEWTSQLTSCAFMIVEDDGGTRTTWKCSAQGKYNSKQYGFDLEIPLNSRDDIVWRGSLSHAYIEKFKGQTASFGDVDLVLELI